MNKLTISQKLQSLPKIIFTLNDIKGLLDIKSKSYTYVLVSRLIESNVITKIIKGYYYLNTKKPTDFEIACYLIRPSYISFESALHYYNILVQAPYTITIATSKISKKIILEDKEYRYSLLNRKYFTDYIKIDNFLIATPEKALVDTLYSVSLGRRSISLEELNLQSIDKRKVLDLASKITNPLFNKYFKSIEK